MKEAIYKISFLLLGGLGTVGLNQSALACKLCEEAAKKAEAVMAQAQSNSGAQPNTASSTVRGQSVAGGYGFAGAANVGRPLNSNAGKLIDGYLDGIGRGSNSPAPSNEKAAVWENVEYQSTDEAIGDGSSPASESNGE